MNNYIFKHEVVLKHVEAELPEKPKKEDYIHHWHYDEAVKAYESSLESIRAKGVEIANPEEVLKGVPRLQFQIMREDGENLWENVSDEVFQKYNYRKGFKYRRILKDGEFYKVECEVREQGQYRHKPILQLAASEWFDLVDDQSIDKKGYEYRTVVYLSQTDWEVCKRSVGQRAIDYAITNYSGTETSDYVMSVAAYSYHRGMNVNGVEVKGEQTKGEIQEEMWEEIAAEFSVLQFKKNGFDGIVNKLKSKFHITRKS